LCGEAGNPEIIDVVQLYAFLVRFGPLLQSVRRVRSFVNDGAANWYHGNISREEAENRLCNFHRTHDWPICYLVRSTPIQNGTFLADTFYVFAASYLKWETDIPEYLHTRLYINKQSQLCVPVEVKGPAYNPVLVPNISMFLSKTLSLQAGKPVQAEDFKDLQPCYENLEQHVKLCPDEANDETGKYFGFHEIQNIAK